MKMRFVITTLLALQLPVSGAIAAPAIEGLLQEFRQQGVTQFDPAAGKQLWNRKFSNSGDGQIRSCASCHTADPRQVGKHVRTGKAIEAMAPSVNPARLSDEKKVSKWLRRNCKWTLGRECSAQEQGDVLMYLKDL